MPDTTDTPMFEVIWEGDVCVPADPDDVPCENPYDWTPIQMDEIPLDEEVPA